MNTSAEEGGQRGTRWVEWSGKAPLARPYSESTGSERACRGASGRRAFQAVGTVQTKALSGCGKNKVTGVAECIACIWGDGPDPGL